MRSYVTHDCAAVRAITPMSKNVSEAMRRANPGMARIRAAWGASARRVRVLRRVLIGGH